ncbi:type II toxin-antitoxin system RelE/ParE family toxin [Alloalcanivorax venustensis]|uniref:type II toxin-antitoxin system RelE/ParE family toxin n=1 Tax=Alloalcanivorax venustensis TaxID=172371 RepID=UPI003519648C
MGSLSLVLSPAAREDLRAIHQYGSRQWGKPRSDEYMSSLKDKLWQLLQQPETGKARPELSPGVRSISVASHVIFYRVQREELQVVRVLHGRQDVNRHV